jgi:hypothetical protein
MAETVMNFPNSATADGAQAKARHDKAELNDKAESLTGRKCQW